MEELESLLSSQESLTKQMIEVSLKEFEGATLVTRKKDYKGMENKKDLISNVEKDYSPNQSSRKSIKCY